MGAQDNKQAAQAMFSAFSAGDAVGALASFDDSIVWTMRGNNALTGVYDGKEAVVALWGEMAKGEPTVTPHDFIAEGDKVAVLATVTMLGEPMEVADVLTFNSQGKIIAMETLGDETIPNRVYPR
jgi:ketosteroid isomerase-like protein